MKCYDLFQLPSLKSIQIIAGEKGLHRKLQWIHFVDNININEYHLWVEKNDLIILTGNNLQNDFDSLCAILPMLAQMPIAGILFNVGMYIQELPEYFLQLADKLQLPVFIIPWEVKLSDVSKDICSGILSEQNSNEESATLLSELLFSNQLSIERQNMLIHDLHFPFYNGFHMGIFRFSPCETEPVDDASFAGKAVAVAQYLNIQFKAQMAASSASMISILHRDEILFMIDADTMMQSKFQTHFVFLQNALQQHFPGVQIFAGASRCHRNALDCRVAYQEAQQAAWAAQAQNLASVSYYEKMEVFRLLTNISDTRELEAFYQDILQPVISYDEINHSELLNTLFCYFDHANQLQETADALFIHKNTLKYRLNKLEVLLQAKLDSPDCITKIVLARNIKRLLKSKPH